MKLGLKRDQVKLAPYSDEWNKEFIRIKEEIQTNTPLDGECIVHIGSTAIKNMDAKPILDILVGVENINNIAPSVIKGLKKIGFLRLKVERPSEIIFAKFTDNSYEEKTHYIHLVNYGDELWQDLIFFRDYLNANETEREKYKRIKLEYVQKCNTGIEQYTDLKKEFVKEIFKKRKHKYH